MCVTATDADATLARVTDSGGTVVMGPMDVFDAGRMAIIQDPAGSFISIWQPHAHIGAELVNEPGTFAWNELATTDLDRARQFYASVFEWGVSQASSDTGTIFTVDDNVTCGAHRAGDGEFPTWSVWFAVDDCDATASKVTDLGGSVLMPASDMDFGRACGRRRSSRRRLRHREDEQRAVGRPARA